MKKDCFSCQSDTLDKTLYANQSVFVEWQDVRTKTCKQDCMNNPGFHSYFSDDDTQLVGKLQGLLSDFQVFQGNVKQLHWNRQIRPYLDISPKLAMLDRVATHQTQQVAEHLMLLGYSPDSFSVAPGLVKTNVAPIAQPKSLDSGLSSLIVSIEQLLESAQDVWEIAREIDEPHTLQLLTQLIPQLRFAAHVFSVSRLAASN